MIEGMEVVLRWLGACAGLGTLAFAIYNMLKAQRQPSGISTGAANKVLRIPYLIIATVLFGIIAFLLWKPLPIQPSPPLRGLFTILGGGIYFGSLVLYVWGLLTLGSNFNASSGFGVRLRQGHQLITRGPYAQIRHPMYMAVILACWGGLLLYRSWTMLVFTIMMLGLIYRAHSEEKALAQAFGEAWEDYKNRVPAWIPNPGSRGRKKLN